MQLTSMTVPILYRLKYDAGQAIALQHCATIRDSTREFFTTARCDYGKSTEVCWTLNQKQRLVRKYAGQHHNMVTHYVLD